jgi:hypothetical protein
MHIQFFHKSRVDGKTVYYEGSYLGPFEGNCFVQNGVLSVNDAQHNSTRIAEEKDGVWTEVNPSPYTQKLETARDINGVQPIKVRWTGFRVFADIGSGR